MARDALEILPVDEQVAYMKAWFGRYFEDPAQETPYNGREGGYLYIHGGPYDAEEEIRGEFESVASEDAIQTAIDDVTSDGTYDWAPTSNHPARIDEGREEYDADDEVPVTAEDLLRRIQGGGEPDIWECRRAPFAPCCVGWPTLRRPEQSRTAMLFNDSERTKRSRAVAKKEDDAERSSQLIIRAARRFSGVSADDEMPLRRSALWTKFGHSTPVRLRKRSTTWLGVWLPAQRDQLELWLVTKQPRLNRIAAPAPMELGRIRVWRAGRASLFRTLRLSGRQRHAVPPV